jgi:hypothetical protein
MTTAEQHALALGAKPASVRPRPMVLVIDEFHEFVAQSEQALAAMLSQTRKFGLWIYMANQDTTQTSERLRGALGNVGLRAVFRLERADAEHYAGILGSVDPLAVKYEVADEQARGSRAPVFYSLSEQWEGWVKAIMRLERGEAFIKLPNGTVTKVRTVVVPDPVVDLKRRAEIEQQYLERYFHAPPESSVPPERKMPLSPAVPQEVDLDD